MVTRSKSSSTIVIDIAKILSEVFYLELNLRTAFMIKLKCIFNKKEKNGLKISDFNFL